MASTEAFAYHGHVGARLEDWQRGLERRRQDPHRPMLKGWKGGLPFLKLTAGGPQNDGLEMAIVGIYVRFLGCTLPKTYWVLTFMEYPSRDLVHFKHEFNQPLPIPKTNTHSTWKQTPKRKWIVFQLSILSGDASSPGGYSTEDSEGRLARFCFALLVFIILCGEYREPCFF